jgi:uncharacterized damage-inducible protein DinB
MTLQDLRMLLDYHYWARDRALDAASALTAEQYARDLGSSFRSVRDTLTHTYGSEWAWCERWHGRSPSSLPSADLFADPAGLRVAWVDQEAGVRAFVGGLGEEGIARVFEYKTLAGQDGSSAFWEMVTHMVNHGSYHRGQITTMLRQLGAAPPKSMDMIAFYRQRDRRS